METFPSRLKMLKRIAAGAVLTALILVCREGNAVQNTPVLQVTVLNGGTSLDFGQLRSLDNAGASLADSSSRRVRLQIINPTNRPYVVSQIVNMEPVNQNGTPLPGDAIRFRVELESGAGMIRTSERTPLEPGLQEIYDGDDKEQTASLLIIYDFQVPPGQKAGPYQASITYRLDVR